jgi:hypothetical protein
MHWKKSNTRTTHGNGALGFGYGFNLQGEGVEFSSATQISARFTISSSIVE